MLRSCECLSALESAELFPCDTAGVGGGGFEAPLTADGVRLAMAGAPLDQAFCGFLWHEVSGQDVLMSSCMKGGKTGSRKKTVLCSRLMHG